MRTEATIIAPKLFMHSEKNTETIKMAHNSYS